MKNITFSSTCPFFYWHPLQLCDPSFFVFCFVSSRSRREGQGGEGDRFSVIFPYCDDGFFPFTIVVVLSHTIWLCILHKNIIRTIPSND